MLDLKEFSPCLLIAMPQLADPNFHRTVVLLAEFRPGGSYGVVINRPLEQTLGAVQSNDVELAPQYQTAPLWFGGPVNPRQALLISNLRPGAEDELPEFDDTSSSWTDSDADGAGILLLGNGLALANGKAMLVDYSCDLLGDIFKVVAGYAGWAGQQLDEELRAGSWLIAPMDKDLIFSAPDTMWDRALRTLGVDPVTLQAPPSSVHH
ncbi:MAG: YqgE/AlgH family protein [Deltaproteobacteria bacterium]|nr:YqgE/AlgH family protein [Deltaproteobacteria bacterium]